MKYHISGTSNNIASQRQWNLTRCYHRKHFFLMQWLWVWILCMPVRETIDCILTHWEIQNIKGLYRQSYRQLISIYEFFLFIITSIKTLYRLVFPVCETNTWCKMCHAWIVKVICRTDEARKWSMAMFLCFLTVRTFFVYKLGSTHHLRNIHCRPWWI